MGATRRPRPSFDWKPPRSVARVGRAAPVGNHLGRAQEAGRDRPPGQRADSQDAALQDLVHPCWLGDEPVEAIAAYVREDDVAGLDRGESHRLAFDPVWRHRALANLGPRLRLMARGPLGANLGLGPRAPFAGIAPN